MIRVVAACGIVFVTAAGTTAVLTSVDVPWWLDVALVVPLLTLGVAFQRVLAAVDHVASVDSRRPVQPARRVP
jgi:hypothetical protein